MSDLKSAKKYAVPADDVFLAYHLKVSPLGYPIETSAVFPRDFRNGFHNISRVGN